MKKAVYIIGGVLIIILLIGVVLANDIIGEQKKDIDELKYRPIVKQEEILRANEIGYEIFNLINIARETRGLQELKYNNLLARAGENHCNDIMEYGYWEHNREGKRFEDFAKELNIEYKMVGENLATDFLTTIEVVDNWMQSEKHREVMLGDFEEAGVGVIKKENGFLLVSTYFIK